MPGQMIGKCAICGKETSLNVTYFHYPVKCECCAPFHSVRVEHCKDCVPKAPQKVFILIRGLDGNLYSKEIVNIKPMEDERNIHTIY